MMDEIWVEGATTIGCATEASVEELVTFERLLADLSARFANTSGDQLETEIGSATDRGGSRTDTRAAQPPRAARLKVSTIGLDLAK